MLAELTRPGALSAVLRRSDDVLGDWTPWLLAYAVMGALVLIEVLS